MLASVLNRCRFGWLCTPARTTASIPIYSRHLKHLSITSMIYHDKYRASGGQRDATAILARGREDVVAVAYVVAIQRLTSFASIITALRRGVLSIIRSSIQSIKFRKDN